MKKAITIILALCILFINIPISAANSNDIIIADISYLDMQNNPIQYIDSDSPFLIKLNAVNANDSDYELLIFAAAFDKHSSLIDATASSVILHKNTDKSYSVSMMSPACVFEYMKIFIWNHSLTPLSPSDILSSEDSFSQVNLTDYANGKFYINKNNTAEMNLSSYNNESNRLGLDDFAWHTENSSSKVAAVYPYSIVLGAASVESNGLIKSPSGIKYLMPEKRSGVVKKEAIALSYWYTGSIDVDIPNDVYKKIHFLAASALYNPTKFSITINYTDGSCETTDNIDVPRHREVPERENFIGALSKVDSVNVSDGRFQSLFSPRLSLYEYSINANPAKIADSITFSSVDPSTFDSSEIAGGRTFMIPSITTEKVLSSELCSFVEDRLASSNYLNEEEASLSALIEILKKRGFKRSEINGISMLPNPSDSFREVYVSADGNNTTADGTVSSPFANISSACEYIKGCKNYFGKWKIILRGGRYPSFETTTFSQNTLSNISALEITSYPGEKVIIDGSVKIDTNNVRNIDDETKSRFHASAADKIIKIDLSAQGISNIKKPGPAKYMKKRGSASLLIAGDTLRLPARWPNNSYATVRECKNAGSPTEGITFSFNDSNTVIESLKSHVSYALPKKAASFDEKEAIVLNPSFSAIGGAHSVSIGDKCDKISFLIASSTGTVDGASSISAIVEYTDGSNVLLPAKAIPGCSQSSQSNAPNFVADIERGAYDPYWCTDACEKNGQKRRAPYSISAANVHSAEYAMALYEYSIDTDPTKTAGSICFTTTNPLSASQSYAPSVAVIAVTAELASNGKRDCKFYDLSAYANGKFWVDALNPAEQEHNNYTKADFISSKENPNIKICAIWPLRFRNRNLNMYPMQSCKIKELPANLKNWTNEENALINCFFSDNDWKFDIINASGSNASDKTITTIKNPGVQLSEVPNCPRRFYIENLLEEIDVPGEWYIDDDNFLYLYPLEKDSDIYLTYSESPLFSISNINNITLKNITMTGCNAQALTMYNAKNCLVESCTFTNIVDNAINADECSDCKIKSCDFVNIGKSAISAYERSYVSMRNNNLVIEDNLIDCFSIYGRNGSAAGIRLTNTIGSKIIHNKILNAPWVGIIFDDPIDNIIEYNDISHVQTEYCDAGAIYCGQSFIAQGNILRYNYIHDIIPYSDNIYGYLAAVYMDDLNCGFDINSNIIARSPIGILLGGGKNLSVTNNIIIHDSVLKAIYPINADDRGLNWASAAALDFSKEIYSFSVKNPRYAAKFPHVLSGVYQDSELCGTPANNTIMNNFIYKCQNPNRGIYDAFKDAKYNNNVSCNYIFGTSTSDELYGSPFVNEETSDYTIKQDSIIYSRIPNFRVIPFPEIGLITKR